METFERLNNSVLSLPSHPVCSYVAAGLQALSDNTYSSAASQGSNHGGRDVSWQTVPLPAPLGYRHRGYISLP